MFFPGITIKSVIKQNINWIIMAAFFFTSSIIIIFFVTTPETSDKLIGSQMAALEGLVEFIMELHPVSGALIIFLNNLFTMSLTLALGALAGLFPLFVLFINGGIVGMLTSITAHEGLPVLTMITAGVLPHGVFELSAFFLSSGLGLKFGYHSLISPLPGRTRMESYKYIWKETITVFPLIVVLLFLAAFIEIMITPLILNYFL